MVGKTTMMAVLASALMAAHGLPAQAQPAASIVTSNMQTGEAQETVPLGDLNLAARSGQAAARLRLLGAVQATCASIYPNEDEADACRAAALVDARRQLVQLSSHARNDHVILAAR